MSNNKTVSSSGILGKPNDAVNSETFIVSIICFKLRPNKTSLVATEGSSITLFIAKTGSVSEVLEATSRSKGFLLGTKAGTSPIPEDIKAVPESKLIDTTAARVIELDSPANNNTLFRLNLSFMYKYSSKTYHQQCVSKKKVTSYNLTLHKSNHKHIILISMYLIKI